MLVERLEDAEPIGRRLDRFDGVAAEAVELGGVLEVVPPRQPVVERRLGRHDAAAAAHLLAETVGIPPEGRTCRGRVSSAPVIMRMAVVLPAPFGPSNTVMRPRGTSKVRSESAGTVPKRRVTFADLDHQLGVRTARGLLGRDVRAR